MPTTDETSSDDAHEIVARFTGMAQARKAVSELEEHGIPASDINLSGPAADEAVATLATARRDDRVGRTAVQAMGRGAGISAAIGVVLVTAITAIAYEATMMALVGGAVAGLLGGGFFGLILGAVAGVKQSEAWELAHQPTDSDDVSVVVRTSSAAEAESAKGVLDDLDPDEITTRPVRQRTRFTPKMHGD